MLKDVILKQKQEKEVLLALPYVKRTQEGFGKKWGHTQYMVLNRK